MSIHEGDRLAPLVGDEERTWPQRIFLAAGFTGLMLLFWWGVATCGQPL